MKKFTLMLLAALISVGAMAQKPSVNHALAETLRSAMTQKKNNQQSNELSKYMRNLSSTTYTKSNSRRASETITPPEGEVISYTFTGSNSRGSGTIKRTVKVIYDNNDVYVTGLSWYLPDAWVKGVIEGNVATFEKGQYFGNPGADLYLAGTTDGSDLVDVTAEYDAETGDFTFTTFILDNQEISLGLGYYAYWTPGATLTKNGEADLPIEVPENLFIEEYSLLDSDGNTASLKIGFDNNDVYIQGLCRYLPEAWVKGTLSNNEITFKTGQLFGIYGNNYTMWFLGYDTTIGVSNVVFTYDETENKLSSNNWILVNLDKTDIAGGNNVVTIYSEPVITKVVEKAAYPANPSISEIYATQYGDEVIFTVPTVDVDGNGLVTSKLSFQFFYDVEKDVNPVVFQKGNLYPYIEEDITIIPYGYKDNNGKGYDFYDGEIFLNMNHSTWNKIGIKSIYRGGGKVNETEIQWYTIKKYAVDIAREALEAEIKTAEDLLADETKTLGVEEFTEAINDAKALLNNEEATADELNAGVTALKEAEAAFILANKDPYEREVTWVASEQGYTNTQKITEFALDENISATVEKGNGTTDPAYYTQGTALRLYAKNSLTINANEDVTKITTIEFTTPSTGQNRGNNISSVPTGYSFLDSTGSWTGEATSVVFTQGGNNGHARISKIFVVYKLKESVVDGINNITINNDAHYFDLQGRVATNATKGLLIKQVRDAQGNVKTVKVVRK